MYRIVRVSFLVREREKEENINNVVQKVTHSDTLKYRRTNKVLKISNESGSFVSARFGLEIILKHDQDMRLVL